jgi:hypothetical protein
LKNISFKNVRLINASYNGDLEKVRRLLENGANIEAKDSGGMTPLYIASINGHANIVKLLLEKGTNIEAKEEGGNTPLHLACKYGHANIVKMLLRAGTSIEAKSKSGETSLHLACEKGHEAIVKVLLAKGADPSVPNDKGKTPLQVAQQRYKHDCVQAIESFLQRQHEAKQQLKQQQAAATRKSRDPELYKQQHDMEQTQIEVELVSRPNHDNIREQLRLVVEKKRRDPVEVTDSYIDEIITGDTLGEGYFGVAYKGFDRVFGKAFALKKVFENAPASRIRGIQDSFQNEMNVRHVMCETL